MKEVHVSNLDKLSPQTIYANSWLQEVYKELSAEPEKGDVFFAAMAYFNTYGEMPQYYETRDMAFEDAREEGISPVEAHDKIGIPFPVYLRLRKGRVISTGLLELGEALEWLDMVLEKQEKSIVLRFADKQCTSVAWYSIQGPWQSEAEDDPELKGWLQGLVDAVALDKLRKS